MDFTIPRMRMLLFANDCQYYIGAYYYTGLIEYGDSDRICGLIVRYMDAFFYTEVTPPTIFPHPRAYSAGCKTTQICQLS